MYFQGCYVALITPFTADGKIDTRSLIELVEWQIDQRTDGLVLLGTTGEVGTLTALEQKHILQTVIAQVRGRVPVIAGTGAISTSATIHKSLNAQALGVDALMVMTPPYVRPPQRGLLAHYEAIAHACKLPILLYNVPGRTGCDCQPETVAELSKLNNIVGIKEAVNTVERMKALKMLCSDKFAILSGDDEGTLQMMRNGANGCISVTANVAPGQIHDLCLAMNQGQETQAQSIDCDLQPLHAALFCETNPIPVKWALHKLRGITPHCRLPLMPLSTKYQDQLSPLLHAAEMV